MFGTARAWRGRLRSWGDAVRRPETMVFVPAATLAAFWLGGERALILMALGLPLLLALASATRGAAISGEALPQPGAALRPQLTAALDAALAAGAADGRTTACLVLQFDEADRLIDRHGRSAQTEVLERSAERLCAALRPGDTVARLEGGGFAVALGPVRRLDLETLVQMSARLQAALAPPIALGQARVYVTASVGFCLATQAPDATGRALVDAAQTAADEALRHGPGGIRAFIPGMARKRADRDAQRARLERALDEGEIRPHFQPQVSTDTGAVSGFEALARWHHPDRGLIPPAEFLPQIEDSGLDERLGEVMLFQSLSALVRWDSAGLRVPGVAVNLSLAELRNPRLADRIAWELDRFDLPPQRLTVEVLETVVAQTDTDVIVHNIAALARMGCGIDLDDFGTGNTSITAIRRFAVKRLKIDRSFVTRLDEDREQQKIVSAILSMAERLGLDTLAEGVETPGEQAMLDQLGCAHVQGFGIGRPMPADEVEDWLLRHAARQAQPLKLGHRMG
ncbi:MAG: GGDEF domain-containing protein [Rhodobacterales bacterium]|nr:GGDEF domain-containing protein [Rhodobacterales bacterium]